MPHASVFRFLSKESGKMKPFLKYPFLTKITHIYPKKSAKIGLFWPFLNGLAPHGYRRPGITTCVECCVFVHIYGKNEAILQIPIFHEKMVKHFFFEILAKFLQWKYTESWKSSFRWNRSKKLHEGPRRLLRTSSGPQTRFWVFLKKSKSRENFDCPAEL